MADECPEHVWVLDGLVTGEGGTLSQRYRCERCPQVLLVTADEPPPHSPDRPG